jgi:hypothetical protein
MLLRDPTLNENIAVQEAEAAISEYYGVDDPYSIDPSTVSPSVMSGLTNLALARCYLYQMISTSQSGDKWIAGLVSLQSTSSSGGDFAKVIEALLKAANHDLGLSYSRVLLMAEAQPCLASVGVHGVDLTRSVVMIDYDVNGQ